MENQQHKTLQSLLRITASSPEQHRLEEMEAAARTRYLLYKQERDLQGAKIYATVLRKIQNARSVKELEKS